MQKISITKEELGGKHAGSKVASFSCNLTFHENKVCFPIWCCVHEYFRIAQAPRKEASLFPGVYIPFQVENFQKHRLHPHERDLKIVHNDLDTRIVHHICARVYRICLSKWPVGVCETFEERGEELISSTCVEAPLLYAR